MQQLDGGGDDMLDSSQYDEDQIRQKRKSLEIDMMNNVKDNCDYLNTNENDQNQHHEKLITLRDRRLISKSLPKQKDNKDVKVNHFENDDDLMEFNSDKDSMQKDTLGSALQNPKQLKNLQNLQPSMINKNQSIVSRNKSMLTAAMDLSNTRNMSSHFSSRLSKQTKKRMIALQSVDTKNEYLNLTKELKINQAKILKDQEWLKEKIESCEQINPEMKR